MGGAEVGHAAGGNAQTSQHCGRRDIHIKTLYLCIQRRTQDYNHINNNKAALLLLMIKLNSILM